MIKIKDINYILIAVILIFIIGKGFLDYSLNKKEAVPVSQKENTEIKKGGIQEEEIAPAIPTPPEEKWETYVSSKLGFSIKYPEMVYGTYKCSPQKPFYVPLKVFEDKESGIVYITEEYYYKAKYDSELNEYTGPCEKIMNSLEYLKSQREITVDINNGVSLKSNPFLTKVFVIKDIKNDTELNKFIKDNYGSECFVKDKKLWRRDGIYEINIEGKDYTKGINPNCPLNYVYKILYTPEKNRVMSVNLGQECGFGTRYVSEESYKCYDGEMIDSFRFIDQNKNNEITYKTFSSPKADFTFEYPSTWVYDEKEIKNTMVWGFYPNLEGNYRNKPPYLAVHSPTYETVDFFSSGYKGTKRPYQLNTFPTNNPETYVTYEQGENGGKAYIYWQKGKAFASSCCIDDIYYKVNIMIFHGSDELEGKEVAQHIAKSIKIK